LQLTDGFTQDTDPEWSPDVSRIAFDTNREGPTHVYVIESNSRGPSGRW
jgi:Tol biopolymer transport system component